MFKILAILVIFFSGCSIGAKKPDFTQTDNSISIMTYNVENLFDNKKDQNREDHTYLPKNKKSHPSHISYCNSLNHPGYKDSCLNLDWSDDVVKMKLFRVADAIQQINNGLGPDILILVEVENKNILDQLNNNYLKKSNYKTAILIEGPDTRGIDIAILSRLDLIEKPKLNKIPFIGTSKEDQKWMSRSRGILQAKLKLPNGEPLHVFGVHFPSPRNPSYWRKQAISYLNKLQLALPANELSIAAGDFNISEKDEQENRLYSKDLASQWLLSHHLGCKDCRGTNYFHPLTSWSFLDAIGFSKSFTATANSAWSVDETSIDIPKGSKYQVNQYLSPARFSEKSPVGVSDHWPLYARIKMKSKK